MCSRLFFTLFAALTAGCLDDTASLSSPAVPQPAPTFTPQDPAPEPGQGGAAGSAEVGGEASGGSAGDGPSSGGSSAGAGGQEHPAQVCEPAAELCNGVDDDCDDDVDEGCPLSLAWKTSSARPALGDSPGGAEFAESCEKDELLVGLKVAAGAWIDQVSGICRKFALQTDTEETPYQYSLSFSETRALAAQPAQTISEVQELACDEHQALVGLRVSQQNYVVDGQVQYVVIPSLWVTCATPVLTVEGDAVSVSWQETVEVGPVAGYLADGSAWFAQDVLTSPELAVTLHGTSGAWIDRLGLGTSSIATTFR